MKTKNIPVVSTLDPKVLCQELEDLFLALAWAFKKQTAELCKKDLRPWSIYFEPLTLPSSYKSSSGLVAIRILEFLVRQADNPNSRKHLLLKNISPALQSVLLDSTFGTETSGMKEFLAKIENYFEPKKSSNGRPYWAINTRYIVRANSAYKKCIRWIDDVALVILEKHANIQRVDIRNGFYLVQN